MIASKKIRIQNITTDTIQTIEYKNLGYWNHIEGYVSQFTLDERRTYNVFLSEPYREFECPTPYLRIVSDCDHLEYSWGSILIEGDI